MAGSSIFWLQSDFSMHYDAWNGTAWTGNYNLGGTFASVPAAESGWTKAKTPRADVFGVGTDYAMYHKAIVNGVLPDAWEDLGGGFMSAPAAIAWGGQVDVFSVDRQRTSTKTQTYPGYNSPDGCGANSGNVIRVMTCVFCGNAGW